MNRTAEKVNPTVTCKSVPSNVPASNAKRQSNMSDNLTANRRLSQADLRTFLDRNPYKSHDSIIDKSKLSPRSDKPAQFPPKSNLRTKRVIIDNLTASNINQPKISQFVISNHKSENSDFPPAGGTPPAPEASHSANII